MQTQEKVIFLTWKMENLILHIEWRCSWQTGLTSRKGASNSILKNYTTGKLRFYSGIFLFEGSELMTGSFFFSLKVLSEKEMISEFQNKNKYKKKQTNQKTSG